MPGRGPQTFKKRQKEQERKERQQEKMVKRLQRKENRGTLGDSDLEEAPDPETDSLTADSNEQDAPHDPLG